MRKFKKNPSELKISLGKLKLRLKSNQKMFSLKLKPRKVLK